MSYKLPGWKDLFSMDGYLTEDV